MKKITRRAPPKCGVQNKARFPSERAADKALDQMWKRAVYRGSKVGVTMPCRSYKCRVCRGWHLTSQKKREKGED